MQNLVRKTCLMALTGPLLGALLAAGSAAPAQGRFQFDATPGHLSKQVVPSRYALKLGACRA